MQSSGNLSKKFSMVYLILPVATAAFRTLLLTRKILMSFFFFSFIFSLFDHLGPDYHLLTLDCSSVCYGAVSCLARVARVSRVSLPVSPVTPPAHSTPASSLPVRARPHNRTTGTACHCFTCCRRGQETTAGIW